MNNLKTTPWILVDFPKNRIRLPKHTLRCLGNPNYVRLLINPDAKTLAIEICDHSEPRGHRIPERIMNSKVCYEIYSSTLCEQLTAHGNWDPNSAYKMFASAQAGEQLLLFKFADAYLSAGGILIAEKEHIQS